MRNNFTNKNQKLVVVFPLFIAILLYWPESEFATWRNECRNKLRLITRESISTLVRLKTFHEYATYSTSYLIFKLCTWLYLYMFYRQFWKFDYEKQTRLCAVIVSDPSGSERLIEGFVNVCMCVCVWLDIRTIGEYKSYVNVDLAVEYLSKKLIYW